VVQNARREAFLCYTVLTMSLPTGTLTFLLTDVQGSTTLWEQAPRAMQEALARCEALTRSAVEQQDGFLVKSRGEGDSVFAVFARAADAALAALALQKAFHAEPWPDETCLSVRIALHTGEVQLRDGDYYGQAINRAARLRSLGNGGQILLSQTTCEIIIDNLPFGAELTDLGEQHLRDLSRPERVFQLSASGLASQFPPLKSPASTPNNLPRQLTSFVGREAEIAEVNALLDGTCLLSLTGAGGTGKSRLSLQAAAGRLEDFPEGVWLAELAALSDHALVVQAVATTAGLREEPDRPLIQTLTSAWKTSRVLLVLDNCEHLVAACAELVNSLLRACPQVKILATSREVLNVPGETVWRVPTLSLPSLRPPLPTLETLSQFEAVRLFIDRALSVLPSFTVTRGNVPAIAQICSQLDGLPLAIELAAARVKVLSPEQIAARLDDQFRLLTGGSRTALPRQQTLRALIDWSYNLLSGPEKILLRRLSVFEGGWTMEAAEVICADSALAACEVLDTLTHLADRSLVVVESGEARYRLLGTLRQYAQERLTVAGETDALRAAHGRFFTAFAEEADARMDGAELIPSLENLESETDNLRAALRWAPQAAEGTEFGLRLVAALNKFWLMRGRAREGQGWCVQILARGGEVPILLRVRALYAFMRLACREEFAADEEAGVMAELLETAHQAGDGKILAEALDHASGIARSSNDNALSQSFMEEALAIRRREGDVCGQSWSLFNLGIIFFQQGKLNEASAFLQEGLLLGRQVENAYYIALNLMHQGRIAQSLGQPGTQRELLQEALGEAQSVGMKECHAAILADLAVNHCQAGEYAEAEQYLAQSVAMSDPETPQAVSNNAVLSITFQAYRGEYLAAYEALAAVAARDLGSENSGLPSLLGGLLLCLNRPREAKVCFAENLAVPVHETPPTSDLLGFACACYQLGEVDEAKQKYLECLKVCEETNQYLMSSLPLAGLAAVAALAGQWDRAAVLMGAAEERECTLAARDLANAWRLRPQTALFVETQAALHSLADPERYASLRAEGLAKTSAQVREFLYEKSL